ncbi:MAG: thiamine phosphate synthase [Nitratireductor sp.]|nr:thiamine phosphate synthase [Nitratireductor sp.]
MSRHFDLSLYLVTDPNLGGGRDLCEIVEAAISGGVTIVQLRDPQAGTRKLVEMAERLLQVTRAHSVPLLINDRVDVALAAGADGVHLGQSDMQADQARALLGPNAIIGLSVGSAAEYAASLQLLTNVDYLGTGPAYATSTKADAGNAIGEAGITAMKARATLPVVAIGGIDAARTAGLIRAGADGVAVVSAIIAAADPHAAAIAIKTEIAKGRTA